MRPDVALVSPYPAAGRRHEGFSGVASYTANLAHGLTGAGLNVRVVAPEAPGPRAYDDEGVRVERSFRRGPRALSTALRAARATGAPVVHLQHELFLYGGPLALPALPVALRAARRTSVPAVVTMHQVVDPSTVDDAYVRMHRVAAPARLARAGLAGVQHTIGRLAARTVVHEPAFARFVPGAAVVPHGVEEHDPADRAAARRRLGLDPDAFTALCFGFVAPYKGLETACAAADLAGVDVVVAGGEHPRLAGRDDYAGELRRRFPAARFTGYVDEADVADWFGAVDVALFCYPRPHAASGALALALAYGTPS
ncbi:MAG: glycosyltransferase, partial [Mycobacteriales bacterium]